VIKLTNLQASFANYELIGHYGKLALSIYGKVQNREFPIHAAIAISLYTTPQAVDQAPDS